MSTKIAIVNGKGGTGKSIVSSLLSLCLAKANKVGVIEADPVQQTITEFVEALQDDSIVLVNKETMDDPSLGFVVIDTAGNLGSDDLPWALRVADVIILVSTPDFNDIRTSATTAKLIRQAGAESRSWVLMNKVRNNHWADAIENNAQPIGLPLMKSKLRLLTAYPDMRLRGGLQNMPRTALDEGINLAMEVIGLIANLKKKKAA